MGASDCSNNHDDLSEFRRTVAEQDAEWRRGFVVDILREEIDVWMKKRKSRKIHCKRMAEQQQGEPSLQSEEKEESLLGAEMSANETTDPVALKEESKSIVEDPEEEKEGQVVDEETVDPTTTNQSK